MRLIGGSQDGLETTVLAATPILHCRTPQRMETYGRAPFIGGPVPEPIEYRYLGPLKPSGPPAGAESPSGRPPGGRSPG